jgi:hypothetical protein
MCDTYFRVENKNLTNLRSHVVSGVAGRHQHPVVRSQLFRESEIADANRLRIPRVVRVQDVRRLEIPATRNRIEERVRNFFVFISSMVRFLRALMRVDPSLDCPLPPVWQWGLRGGGLVRGAFFIPKTLPASA